MELTFLLNEPAIVHFRNPYRFVDIVPTALPQQRISDSIQREFAEARSRTLMIDPITVQPKNDYPPSSRPPPESSRAASDFPPLIIINSPLKFAPIYKISRGKSNANASTASQSEVSSDTLSSCYDFNDDDTNFSYSSGDGSETFHTRSSNYSIQEPVQTAVNASPLAKIHVPIFTPISRNYLDNDGRKLLYSIKNNSGDEHNSNDPVQESSQPAASASAVVQPEVPYPSNHLDDEQPTEKNFDDCRCTG
uniref:Uncharacterized protein n=1 Tax=Fopius arisanus TaxID=64838 RepID=A0A0C9RT32_9HYME